MKSLLELPSREFVDFLTKEVSEWQQINRLGCTFWMGDKACFCQVNVFPDALYATMRPVNMGADIGAGAGCAVHKVFKRDDEIGILSNEKSSELS